MIYRVLNPICKNDNMILYQENVIFYTSHEASNGNDNANIFEH